MLSSNSGIKQMHAEKSQQQYIRDAKSLAEFHPRLLNIVEVGND